MKPISHLVHFGLFSLFLCLIFFLSAFHTQALQSASDSRHQVEQDTSQARILINKAEIFQDSARYDSAIVYYQKAASFYEPLLQEKGDSSIWKAYLLCKNEIGVCYTDNSKYEQGLQTLLTAIAQGRSNLGEDLPQIADLYNNIGRVYVRQASYQTALEYFQKALKIYIHNFNESHPKVANIYNNIGLVSRNLGDYDAALKNHRKALEARIEAFGENHVQVAASYNNLGLVHLFQGDYDAALENHRKALKIRIEVLGENHPEVGGSYSNIGIVYRRQGLYEAALKNYQASLKIDIEVLGEKHRYVAMDYHNIGLIYDDLGFYEVALENYQKALKIKIDLLKENHPDVGSTYHNMGGVYYNQGSYQAALENYQKALTIFREALGADHPNVTATYNNIGSVYNEMELYKTALEYHQKALEIRLRTLGENHEYTASSYNNIGRVYYDQGFYREALKNLERALKIRIGLFGESHVDVAESYNNIGSLLNDEGSFVSALETHQKALDIRIGLFGEKHPSVARSYNSLGKTYFHQGAYEKALENHQKALIANAVNFKNTDLKSNPNLDREYLSEQELLWTLQQKAKALLGQYQQRSSNLNNLELSNQTYELAAELIDHIRRKYDRQEDKSTLLKNSFVVYEGIVQTAGTLFEQAQKEDYLHQAFSAFENSRSMLLLEALRETKAKKFGGLPDSLVSKENDLNVRLAFYEKKLFEEKLEGEKADSASMILSQNQIFHLNQSLDSVVRLLETKYPEYYRLKYDDNIASISNVQAMLPDEKTALLEYFTGDSSIYVFVLKKNDYHLIEIKKDFPLKEWVEELVQNINKPAVDQYQSRKDTMASLAHQIYQKIFAPIERRHELPPKLIIIPDGPLGYLPFEVLLSKKPDAGDKYSDFDFLIKHYQISYCFSATLLQEMYERKHSKTKGRFLAFAPAFKAPKRSVDSLLFAQASFAERQRSATRSEFSPLDHNIPEAIAVGQIIGGDVLYTDDLATQDNFLANCSDYQIVHLASHAKANDKIGDYSWIAFHQKDSASNEFLYNRDLYNLQLQADLVVLSACETGGGELQKGEGIVGLTRGFSYAGAKSLVASLWRVNDRSTRDLMQDFYHGIKAGQSKDDALRQAKLNQLGNNDYADPFYWAAFVPIGDMRPIALNGGVNWGLWGGLGVLTIAAGLFFFFRRR